MSANTEQILNQSVNDQEPLRLPRRLEALHLPFLSPSRLVRNLGPVVRVLRRVVRHRGHDPAMRCRIAPQFIDHYTHGLTALTFEQFAKELLRCAAIAPRLNEDVNQITILVDGSP